MEILQSTEFWVWTIAALIIYFGAERFVYKVFGKGKSFTEIKAKAKAKKNAKKTNEKKQKIERR